MDLTQKILGDLKLEYDVVEDLNKMKENITIFELCKITQLREPLREYLQHIHQKYAEWVLVECGIELPIQRVLRSKFEGNHMDIC